jgi:[glutamine synthetase] adenylyltransferase / [glutamine synthetase]-adenylyl-L-tyrosine phosphorylase
VFSQTGRNPLTNVDTGISLEKLLLIADEPDLQSSFSDQLDRLQDQLPAFDRGLANLLRFVERTRVPKSFMVFLDRDRDALPSLLQILSIDSNTVEWLIEDPDSFDWLRLSAGQAVASEHLKDAILNEVNQLEDEPLVLASMQRFRKRETLRVICAVSLHDMPIAVAAQQLSWIADAILNAALVAVNTERKADRRFRSLQQAGITGLTEFLALIGIGSLGGQELDFESSLEIVLLLDTQRSPNDPIYSQLMDELTRLIQRVIELVTSPLGPAYELHVPFNRIANAVDAPDGTHVSFELVEYQRWIESIENQGRTWVRLQLMKSRFLVGNPVLANRFLEEFPTLVYRRFLSRSDIVGIGALKRKLNRDGLLLDADNGSDRATLMESLSGWKREIEFLVQFLQLINGGELKQVRISNTLSAIGALARSGCLTEQERAILFVAYNRFLQLLMDMQIHSVAEPSQASVIDAQESWSKVRQIRDHLRNEVFVDDNQASDETDLILDPHPQMEWVENLLSKFGFTDFSAAYRNLMDLAMEEVAMLSTRRCRHFLSIIAPQLLHRIGKTPDPDLTLENLASSARSLGGKGILWELFSIHEASMHLYVRLCGASPYLVGILTNNPGMVDELLDSLMLNRLPTEQQLGFMLHELCRGADDIEPIVQSFKNAHHLNVGVRDILGKESITDTHRALSDIADVCLQQTIDAQFGKLTKRFGLPTTTDGAATRFAVVALGKLGAREPNYHSDINMLVLFDEPGETRPLIATRHHEAIASEFFFHQLAQKVSQSVNRVGRSGRLFELKNWMISPSNHAMLAWTLNDLIQSMVETPDNAIQRQQWCNMRCIVGPPDFANSIHQAVLHIVKSRPWTVSDTAQVLDHRALMEHSASARNLKRGKGGTMDVETIAQLLILQNVANNPDLLVCGTLEGIERLRSVGLLDSEDASTLRDGYNFLRGVESGLRLMNTLARHDLPTSPNELDRLAYVLNLPCMPDLEVQCSAVRDQHRTLFKKYFDGKTSHCT